uniref:Caveolin n=1 Tax=Magallana gigas TaxID=29159 RepID=K1QY15_MAGGI
MASDSGSKPSEVKLTITNENVNTSDVTKGIEVDLNERDPNDLHDDLKCFTNTKIWCYRITSLICALPVSFCWGIYFACFAFHNIWILMPCLKAYGMNLRLLRSCFNSIIETFVKPCYMAAGYVFFNIRILKGGDPA